MSRELLLSLDLGTTGVRALVVDAQARIRAHAYRALKVLFPAPGRVEQDADDMWQSSVEVMVRALREAGAGADSLAGIGVVSQRGATVAWDATSLRPHAPVIGWQDARTRERVAGFRKLGLPLNTQASSTKLEWWMQNDPGIAGAARAGTLRVGTPDVWLGAKLTGGAAHVTDPSNASSTALFDNKNGVWAEGLIELFSVPREALPRLVATNEVVGETPAGLLGAPVPVAARAGDQQAATFGQGAHHVGDAKLTLGTSAMLDLNTGDALRDAPPGAYPLSLWLLRDGTRAFALEASVLTAGSAVEWLVEIGLATDAAEVDRLARSLTEPDIVEFVPALQGLGTPWVDDEARGVISGLTRGAGRAHIARALLDGIAQRCVDLIEALRPESGPLRIDGGLAQSGWLMQRIADCAGRELRRAAQVEATALGGAFFAGLATGVFASPESCAKLLEEPLLFRPGIAAEARAAARERWIAAVARARS